MEFPHRCPVVHGIEGGNLIDSHWGHLQYPSDLVHNADGRKALLPLAEVEERHDRRLLILGRVAFEDLFDESVVLRGELEGDIRVVVGSIAMLKNVQHVS